MSYNNDDEDWSSSSEFDSEDEEMDYGLYAQLYFEPNLEATYASTSSQVDHGISLEETFEKNINGITDSSETSLLAKEDKNKPQQGDKTCMSNHPSQFCLSEESNAPCSKVPQTQARKERDRLSSICSEGSIPGHIPLDDLYCNIITIDDDVDIEADTSNKLSILDRNTISQNDGHESRRKSKRKRNDEGDSDECVEEESRCDSLVLAEPNSAGTTISKRKFNLVDDCINFDSDVYACTPPRPKVYEIVTLSSDAQSESDGEVTVRTKTSEAGCSLDQLTEETFINNPKRARVVQNSINNTTKNYMRATVRTHSALKIDEVLLSSDDDSDSDISVLDLKNSPNLTLNIDTQLSTLLQDLAEDDNGVNEQHKLTKKNCRLSLLPQTIDFSRGRLDTRKKSTCDHWTQEMVNFYDSDVSEDLEIKQVHQQQTNAKSSWGIISSDYLIKHSRRYYDAQVRCTRCKQYGHMVKECPRVPHCHLCSGTDHIYRHQCPDNCCFRCGGNPHMFCPDTANSLTCSLCGYKGHRKELCPDLWRRFHNTISGEVPEPPPRTKTRPTRDRFCYNCGKRGHYGHNCPKSFQNHFYLKVPQSVISYSSPTSLKDGSSVVSSEGPQIMEYDIIKFPIKDKEDERLLEQGGVITKEMDSHSGVNVHIDSQAHCAKKEPAVTIPIKAKEIGRLLGQRGVIMKEIMRRSGAYLHIDCLLPNKKVFIYGSSEACCAAQEMVEVLLGQKPFAGLEDFISFVSKNQSSAIPLTGGYVQSLKQARKEKRQIKKTTYSPLQFNYLLQICGSKSKFLKTLRQNLSSLKNVNPDIGHSLIKLKEIQTALKQKHVIPYENSIKEMMRQVSCVVVGAEKYTYGQLRNLMMKIQKSKNNCISEDMCSKIAFKLGNIYSPHLGQLDELIEFGTRFEQSRLDKSKNEGNKTKKVKKLKAKILKDGETIQTNQGNVKKKKTSKKVKVTTGKKVKVTTGKNDKFKKRRLRKKERKGKGNILEENWTMENEGGTGTTNKNDQKSIESKGKANQKVKPPTKGDAKKKGNRKQKKKIICWKCEQVKYIRNGCKCKKLQGHVKGTKQTAQNDNPNTNVMFGDQ
ncbi:uncharacterized protein LOC121872019 [Homarus americanus]|uniref:Zinc finger CCHC domain-containing protein 7 n=1 Tax=Homarus americanus TaxID=6706 RepID=A0A8J5JZ78_HOMAM|nr:uncharacterized protein LOC121872019 [Homarus americanus]XP_042230591.1 uncharacterized protein LOC121872019 [Homarus americanus]XP_042230592.1 uncharacterized protein LOC121872019 [Homarus americanus]KAG7164125.1 Zinc finger CCHC domain-containing protein 7-like [Homarus americanus]